MTSIPTRALALAALGLFPSLPGAGPQDSGGQADALPEPDPAITAAELEHHVRYLASDELRGREAGTPDAVRAAHYLARALEQAGCQPAGDDDTFLQAVPLERWVHTRPPELAVTLANGEQVTGTYGVDFTVSSRGAPISTETLEVLPVASAAELPDEPDASLALFIDGGARRTYGWLGSRGLPFEGWGLFVDIDPSGPGEPSSGPRSGVRPVSEESGAGGMAFLTLRGKLGEALAAFEIASLALTYHAEREAIDDYNVIGRIDGVGTPEHPELAREVIVYSAHYDHLGTRQVDGDADADTVFNGADDDASGTAAVLELAQAFAAGEPPARTLLFLLAAGEEKGLIGTRYYLDHPALPLELTVANLNFEMLGRPDELVGPGKLWLTGFERTTLGPAFREAGFDVVADERPEQNFFQRSDNYALAQRGVVAQSLSSYGMHTEYHTPDDEIGTLDFEHLEAVTRVALAATASAARGELTPVWREGGRP